MARQGGARGVVAQAPRLDQAVSETPTLLICAKMNPGAIRLKILSAMLWPERISALPDLIPAIARLASTSTGMPFAPFMSVLNSSEKSGVSVSGGANSTIPKRR